MNRHKADHQKARRNRSNQEWQFHELILPERQKGNEDKTTLSCSVPHNADRFFSMSTMYQLIKSGPLICHRSTSPVSESVTFRV